MKGPAAVIGAVLAAWLISCGPPASSTRRPPQKPARQILREVRALRPCPVLVPGKAVRFFSELDLRISTAKRKIWAAHYVARDRLKDRRLAACLKSRAEALDKTLERLDDRTASTPTSGQFLQLLARYAASEYNRAQSQVAAARRCITQHLTSRSSPPPH